MSEESARGAVFSCAWWGTGNGFSSETFLADVSALRDGKVADWTIVWIVGRVMGVDEHLVTLVDWVLVSLVRTGIDCLTMFVFARVGTVRSGGRHDCRTRGTRRLHGRSGKGDGFGGRGAWSGSGGSLFKAVHLGRRRVLVVGRRASIVWGLVLRGSLATIEGFI